MGFDENLEKLKLVNLKIKTNENQELCKALESIKSILNSKSLKNELNENFCTNEQEYTCQILNNLIEDLLCIMESKVFVSTEIQNSIDCISLMYNLNIKQFFKLDSMIIIRILKFMDQDSYTDPKKSINVLLNMSEHQFYDNIIFTNANRLEMILEFLEKLKLKFPIHSDQITRVENNLKEKSLKNRLSSLKSSVNLDFDEEKDDFFICKNDFLKDLRFVSIILNNENNCKYFEWDIFSKYGSFQVYTQCFSYFIGIIDKNYKEADNDETVFRSLRDLLEVIFKLAYHSFEFNQNFLDQGLFQIFIDFFDNQNLLEFLFDGYINILSKTISIFYCFCRQIFYNSASQKRQKIVENEFSTFRTLRKSRDIIENLTNNEFDQECQGKVGHFKTYYIYFLKLVSLTYLQAKYNPQEKLLNFDHYKVIATRGFVQTLFKKVSNEFSKNDRILLEFLNEKNEIEIQKITRLTFVNNSHSVVNTVVDALNNIKVVFASTETKKLAYPNYIPFFKSVLYYGLDIEKIICLNCLISFCAVEEIKSDLFKDSDLINFLRSLKETPKDRNDSIKERLQIILTRFLS
jgi:hypothetical protein